MPIEIRELIIKATVSQNEQSSGGGAAASTGSNNVSATEEIVSTCVERILEILKDKHER